MNRAQEHLSALIKYASICNGTALLAAFGTMGKAPIVPLGASVGKLPLWCFSLGLFASGLHLVFCFVLETAIEAAKLSDKLPKRSELQRIRISALELGKLFPDCARIEAESEDIRTKLAGMGLEVKVTGALRSMTEMLLWLSYLLFFVGLFTAVWAV